MKELMNKHGKKVVAGGSFVGIITALIMGISGCEMSYDHTIENGLKESYKVELKTDDFILALKKLDSENK